MKNINFLLNEFKTEQERIEEIFDLVPELKKEGKVYYDSNKYIYLKNNIIYNGQDDYNHDTKIQGAFPYIFILNKLYNLQISAKSPLL